MSRNIVLELSYDGTSYHGWQSQANAASVQSTLNTAVSSLFNEPIKVVGCGRTDTGVHAQKYIASLRTDSEIPVSRVAYALSSLLPNDISVKSATVVPDDFHPVHSCVEKEYTYYIRNSQTKDPFYDRYALHYRYPLDTEKLSEAAGHFVGTHDFSSMRSLGTPVKSTVRTIYRCDVTKSGDIVAFTISADGFLYNMARTIVGTLLEVAANKILPEDITSILESRDRTRAGATAPAHGLHMTNIIYPERFGI
ncbi:MAG: tRNA pseudouridine(38-40) synthase TruA [Oscillospiraceae bacterium]|nr:tRNA pseudouridine(38-40) synthase TruA [Oscillospiraceae bacterium]